MNYVLEYRGRQLASADPLAEAEATAALQSYLTELEAAQLHPTTVDKYHHCLKTFLEWLRGETVSAQSAKAFLNYLRQQGFKPATRRIYYHAMRPFLTYLGIPLQVKFKKDQTPPPYYSTDQVRAVLQVIDSRNDRWNHLKERDSLMVKMLAYTGVRRAELLALHLRDINFQNGMLRVWGKGDKERLIRMPDALLPPLRKYTERMQPGDRLFPIQPRRLWSIISHYAGKAGIENFSPHSFRHYYCTQLAERAKAPKDIKVIQELMGHANVATTLIYFGVRPQDSEDVVSRLPSLEEERDEPRD